MENEITKTKTWKKKPVHTKNKGKNTDAKEKFRSGREFYGVQGKSVPIGHLNSQFSHRNNGPNLDTNIMFTVFII